MGSCSSEFESPAGYIMSQTEEYNFIQTHIKNMTNFVN
jgi:hypothetical protein